ncbi:MBL fold metallo-hydrolase [Pelagicoccus sp. SDUM812003]|uniref:MBL fold metallo-hydrolase n=1 Tax=Pelagicoccus sp. SDUM812003 TaxID=3041267 RepID=UPI00280C4E21|nr:MBL fold metallo-hydrolase [Pelagicoccus sp. SDUM812003]MDQ8203481.1 MBL fold metallo-hydrolase [Pelagicoccus sp. SDUM812003]
MKTIIIATVLFVVSGVFAQSREVGPYTLHPIAPGVIRVEDANHTNPPGLHYDENGEINGFNNCSDMYLVVGGERALLIDLSNFITWHDDAVGSLQTLVKEEIGARELVIAITHVHGDHTGMLPAFRDDENVTFWIQTEEFAGKDLFPVERTTPISSHPSLDLGGGVIVDTLELPGHTSHSTVYFLRGENLLFSGDAIGSGGGVWIFSAEGFARYRKSVDQLIEFIQNPAHGIAAEDLQIYGGHYWQKGEKDLLTMQYILDMKSLIGEIKAGSAKEESVSFSPYLDTNFSYGEATITWNKADSESFQNE